MDAVYRFIEFIEVWFPVIVSAIIAASSLVSLIFFIYSKLEQIKESVAEWISDNKEDMKNMASVKDLEEFDRKLRKIEKYVDAGIDANILSKAMPDDVKKKYAAIKEVFGEASDEYQEFRKKLEKAKNSDSEKEAYKELEDDSEDVI